MSENYSFDEELHGDLGFDIDDPSEEEKDDGNTYTKEEAEEAGFWRNPDSD